MNDLLIKALSYYGLREVFGPEHNPEIVKFFHDIGYKWVNDDETAWCSAFMNYICMVTGYERSMKLDARSWLKLPVKVIEPTLGDIVIFSTGDPTSWKGHVGIYISRNTNYVYTLGGNQSNMVGINPYLISRVLGYRKARKLTDIT
jgi:uncharacterized protein (TIGR02594 family)